MSFLKVIRLFNFVNDILHDTKNKLIDLNMLLQFFLFSPQCSGLVSVLQLMLILIIIHFSCIALFMGLKNT